MEVHDELWMEWESYPARCRLSWRIQQNIFFYISLSSEVGLFSFTDGVNWQVHIADDLVTDCFVRELI